MQVVAVTQARIASQRLPGKILLEANGVSLLEMHLRRILKAKKINNVIVATTFEDQVDKILNIAVAVGAQTYQGSLNDVLDRFYQAVRNIAPDYVVRLTSDCPLIDPALIDKVVSYAIALDLDYCSNTLEEKYPDGQDIEVFKFSALEHCWQNATLASDREHVTPYIRRNSTVNGGTLFTAGNFQEGTDFGKIRMTVDEQADFDVIRSLTEALGLDATMEEYVSYMLTHPAVTEKNKGITRNEGYQKSLRNDQ